MTDPHIEETFGPLVYDPDKVVVTLNGQVIEGFVKDSLIVIQREKLDDETN